MAFFGGGVSQRLRDLSSTVAGLPDDYGGAPSGGPFPASGSGLSNVFPLSESSLLARSVGMPPPPPLISDPSGRQGAPSMLPNIAPSGGGSGMFGSPSAPQPSPGSAQPSAMTSPGLSPSSMPTQGTVAPLPALPQGMFAAKHHPDWRALAGVVGNALLMDSALNGNQGAMQILNMLEQRRHDQQAAAEQAAQDAKPKVQVIDGSIYSIPSDGVTHPTLLTSAPTGGDRYAASLGYTPGSPEYDNAVRDFALKGDGPSGFAHASALQNDRLNVDVGNNIRNNSTSRANNIRTTLTEAANNTRMVGATERGQDMTDLRDRWAHSTPPAQTDTPSHVVGGILAKQAAGQTLSPQEAGIAAQYWQGRGRGRGRAGGPNPGGSNMLGPVHVNPQTNQRIQYSTQAGGYVDLATGKRVQ